MYFNDYRTSISIIVRKELLHCTLIRKWSYYLSARARACVCARCIGDHSLTPYST